MGDFIEFIEGTAIAVWVRESPSIFAYTTVLSLHAMGLAIVVGVGAAVSLRVMGVFRGLPLAPMLRLFPIMWIGFTINALSGVLLLMANASGMLSNFMFLIKLSLIAVAVVNMELLRHRLAAEVPAGGGGVGDVPSSQVRALALSSLVLWIAVIISGRLTAYPNFVIGLFS
ncbi:MAG TPA: hypothetical protein VF339_07185 [Gammaproteobacteria bacterium]